MENIWLLIALLVPIVIYRIFKPRIKGVIGEKFVALKLDRLPKSNYKVINNLVLNVSDWTSQIDHVVISDFGLFVIETKNLKGWIFGGEHSEYWTQVIYNWKSRFYNPILQNRSHVRALKHCLIEFPQVNYIPIVVFSNSSTLKLETNYEVVYSAHLLKTIKSYSEEVTLSEAEKEAIFSSLSSANDSANYKRSSHIKSIRLRISKRSDSIAQNICPQCGGDLILRKGKFGKFKGCSRFPKCMFTI